MRRGGLRVLLGGVVRSLVVNVRVDVVKTCKRVVGTMGGRGGRCGVLPFLHHEAQTDGNGSSTPRYHADPVVAGNPSAPRPTTDATAPSTPVHRPDSTPSPSHATNKNSNEPVWHSARRPRVYASRPLIPGQVVLLQWRFLGLVFRGWGLGLGFC